ncbi:hypothetical protein [Tenacibaculum sp. SG-28]|uniref:hypothetical protein n=1 Tax=Tenacibaculum sp. SG-28 TaxID=754426 RepID=UPI000CF3E1BC|nr:hypothetical protein [Tenacibaculum sp. SG-28]PQJ21763.1 hypothetical protein BSU00_06755 [Tenacibaculum sp. SG-28]
MKTLVKILFVIFLFWMALGVYLRNTQHPKAEVVMGLGVFFMAFVLMPVFIYYRYRDGKYKKYIMNSKDTKKKTKLET